MKHKIYFVLISLLLNIPSIHSQSAENNQNNKAYEPSPELISFTQLLETLDWRADPERLKKVAAYGELNRNEFKYFEEKPFYPIQHKNASINSDFFKRVANKNEFDFIPFKSSKSIWGYFYRGPKKGDLISDGVIEQWSFENAELATMALEIIRKHGGEIYFNTQPYCIALGNKLYIFQTRAMKFSLEDQGKVFKLFVDKYVKSTKQ